MLEKTIKELEKGLPPSVVSKRKQAGRELSYIEGHYAIDTANRIFGYEGWQMAIKQLDLYDTDKGYEAVAVVQLKVADADGDIVRTDVGTGDSSIKMGRDKAVKEAVTDAMKRAFRTFGSQFGNSLYDKTNPVHNGKADSHAVVEKFSAEESGQVSQQFRHDIAEAKSVEEWVKICAFYADDIQKLESEEQKNNLRAIALEKKKELENV